MAQEMSTGAQEVHLRKRDTSLATPTSLSTPLNARPSQAPSGRHVGALDGDLVDHADTAA